MNKVIVCKVETTLPTEKMTLPTAFVRFHDLAHRFMTFNIQICGQGHKISGQGRKICVWAKSFFPLARS